MPESSTEFAARLFARAAELQAEGKSIQEAHGLAWLEERVSRWPSAWGNELRVLIYGDFSPPEKPVSIPQLSITVLPEPQKNTVIRDALTVLEARVKVDQPDIGSMLDAVRRVNLLLGSFTLNSWCNTSSGWWSWLTHEGGGSASAKFDDAPLASVIDACLQLPPNVRRKIDAAMFWLREPRRSIKSYPQAETLRRYSAYWNAFECLVDAVTLLRPAAQATSAQKQEKISKLIADCGGTLTPAQVQKCYQEVVNPGFVGKAVHALTVCFGPDGKRYANACFRRKPESDRLYNIRNAINHGEVDGENPLEVNRIAARLSDLTLMVLRMFARITPYPFPAEFPGERTD